jgi:acetoin utilization deacetylase AcuC-like enzyme
MVKIAWRPEYRLNLPEGHRFPMLKYDLIPEQLLYEGIVELDNFFCPGPMAESDILLTHTLEYWTKLKSQKLTAAEIRKNGFPLSPELVFREICINQGTLEAAEYALQYGVALNVAGGTHHAYADSGEGFCILNDFACAANVLLKTSKVQRILIVDLDVHQGNGTAAIFSGKEEVFTFSMHGASNYPLHKEKSDWDIPLSDGLQDVEYMNILTNSLPKLIELHQPDLIFYLSGVDVLATDKLGRLGLSREGCRLRDYYVLETAYKHRIPIAIGMGGGYSENIRDIVDAHCNTFRIALELWGR